VPEPTLLANLRAFAWKRAQTLDLLFDYLGSLIERWNDIFFLSLPMLPFIVWWYLGDPPMTIRIVVFLLVLIFAGYFAWRKEHLRHTPEDFRSWIYTLAATSNAGPDRTGPLAMKVFIGLRIANVGPDNSIHTWQVSFVNKNGGRSTLSDYFLLDDGLVVPDGIRGCNLHHDIRKLETGDTKEGWIAIDVGDEGINPDLMKRVSVGFTDAFDVFHEVTLLSGMERKIK
jgi:hypothetical protein